MICDNLRIIKGNVAEYNTFPVFSPSNEKNIFFLEGIEINENRLSSQTSCLLWDFCFLEMPVREKQTPC
mgnify:CR=1 FL=1